MAGVYSRPSIGPGREGRGDGIAYDPP